ncbi:MAG: hypothetical protein COW11_05650 [Candidatus Omnitrophica bacterium CG12_big_fil_rev_8_21_14_0_65_43_15]|uniref:Pyridoxamine 5'-phosphate oxidase N-terminal domain-containing protein n=1 Tax=Candidatus Taenaricola geysiri TaxID=1974752 RepID=A0A2J0LDT5_9BACT|nr:MAG: hypothetical protein COU52_02805 [Candidatus Omnitrophica bacterium CG10_big_fil_rev_8_21_14_0_10_43_8]PIV11994.1 MAG: hypothetical protein COS48_03230 [Candidatus Omnitrophica bacterium CG03_land_8_20_14_0_80_43_22]PIW66012.1 MAG: hypothetical protein COW11_05650 [Candidatus Omnitrophica bacterium CG12_big_fil_rev_8_21_14_0_65_43_15]PIY84391.1 MAG: hypothetical protein COY77_02745 [Candidatus Omnitrophica bacterium CG_4_10_14_0_8_um_filter_43_18]PJC46346.1 MAG: hypothetical protein CO0
MKLNEDVIDFFNKQNFVIVSTIDKNAAPHSSCKGIVKIDPKGIIYLLDLYKGKTRENLANNNKTSLTAVDEHKFKGYCLKGTASEIAAADIDADVADEWKKKITQRITHRLIKNIHGEKGHPYHPEAQMPRPEYIIRMDVEEVIDLTPQHLK